MEEGMKDMGASAEPFRPRIIILRGKIMGYGGPDVYWSKGIHGNRLLWHVKAGSEGYEATETERRHAKWRLFDSKARFAEALDKRPLASELCSNCGHHTIDGASQCLERVWCQREPCRRALEKAREDYRVDREKREADRLAAADAERQSRVSEYRAFAGSAFHYQDGWFFKGLADGSVRIVEWHDGDDYAETDLTIDPHSWASIVCSVSAGGETGERWRQQLDFHGEHATAEGGDAQNPHQRDS